jgi:hypothetical protein
MRCDEPLDIHFRVGTRSELDRRFRQAIEGKLPEQNMSNFVKTAVAEWYESKQRRQEEISEAERVRRDLEAKIRRLEGMIRSGAGVVIETAAAGGEPDDEIKISEVEEKVKALMDVF